MNKLYLFVTILIFSCKPSKQENPYLISGDGYVNVEGGKVWYGIMGEGNKPPYIHLHGGPGDTSHSGLALKNLSGDRPIILIDQLGSGLSSYHEDTTLLRIENFVEQVKAVKEALNLNEFYLTGESWGAALALEYYLSYPEGVRGIAFSSPYFSTSTWIADTDTLISTLSDSTQQTIAIAEQTNSFTTESYRAAMNVFFQNFILRTPQNKLDLPSYAMFDPSYDTLKVSGNNFIYNYMWGASEFSPTGTLMNYERIETLNQISVPVLLITGEFDEARPTTVQKFASLVPGSEFIEILGSGHATKFDNPKMVIEALRDFARKIDQEKIEE